ncbi:tRNA 2-selenouridine(34) synthase MnmH [Clostridium sardiniense]|uniref:tRNA 2-selenouridine(34) synthase MnmH n=1 Tax=Clostridium sardiniense TaxID=29369 RepID=A0ABS7L011_CLOSR|nr:tRNA 2-selenouridine(34) synthase MnmH [Clostridium sardiniense]MBY0756187.1 tRNA 2-selenouridine(34) synthase MnmH [Clostridium sardiniense]MDQ0458870.1 tRNA 2-selenouridine synthase [Clostridium sardiniense]
MFNIIDYKDIVDDKECILIDVRSPKEYKEATIKGAINIPVLLDDERDIVGTLYVRESVEAARTKGIEFISKRLPQIFNDIQNMYNNGEKKIVLFCSRGGMRSGSIYSLLYSLGIKVYKLRGGYKGYRKYINDNFEGVNKGVKYIVLHGKTGVGKTEYLKALKEKGFDILDLEGAANHRGSFLGSISLGKSNTQKMFETEIFEALKNRKGNLVFVEGESKRIGNIIIPEPIWSSMEDGIKIYIEDSIENRSEILIKEYIKGNDSVKELIDCLDNLKRYLNDKRVEEYKKLLKECDYKTVCEELMLKYYDPLYSNSFKIKDFYETIVNKDRNETINRLIDIYNKNT